MNYFVNQISQLWPPAPSFTEKDVANQAGKVFIVTGASTGVGKELARLLYLLDAKVYLAGRSESRVEASISQIQAVQPQSKGKLVFLRCDLEDLASVHDAAKSFEAKEQRLDALIRRPLAKREQELLTGASVHNAGVMMPPEGSRTKQGYELQLGVHTLAPLLLTDLLTPLLAKTAETQPKGSVRVVWVASSAAEIASPPGGVEMDNLDYKRHNPSSNIKYGTSKAGMALLAKRYAELHEADGIISIGCNPGNLRTDLRRHLSWSLATVFGWISHDSVKGAYTELYSAFSPELADKTGSWVIPWGRISAIRDDIARSALSKAEGGSGLGEEFYEWCEKQLQSYKD